MKSGRWSLWGDIHISDHLVDLLHRRLIQPVFLLHRRFSPALTATFMSARPTYLFEIFKDRLTCMTCPSNMHSNRLEFSSRRRERLLRITRITFRIFREFGPWWSLAHSEKKNRDRYIINVRISRAFRATLMVALLTCYCPAIKWSITLVAESTDPLHRLTAEELLLAGSLKDGQWGDGGSHRPLESFIHSNSGTLGPFPAVILGSHRRIPRAFLATGMLAGDANLIGAKRDIASMACTTYADAHNLFHSLRISAGWWCPFPWFELESVLHEHGTSFLFLNSIADSSSLGKSLAGLCESRLGVLDRLLQSGRNRGAGGRSPGLRSCVRGGGQGRAAVFFQLRTSTQS